MPRFLQTTRRSGLTLVELLVVITILIILVAVLLPMMQLGTEARVVREATRQVNGYLAAAQARAIASGHPVGVMFARSANNPSQCFQLAIAKVPPPYSGDGATSVAEVTNAIPPVVTFWADRWTGTPELIPETILPVGSVFQIRLNHRGRWYTALRLPGHNYVLDVKPGDLLPTVVTKMPFQIRRPPRPSAANPLKLPVGAYIDLHVSGTGTSRVELQPLDSNPGGVDGHPIILFGPRGNVEAVYASDDPDNNGVPDFMPFVPMEPIHVLIARAEDQGSPTKTSSANLVSDAESLWLTVNPSSGKVHSAESLGGLSLVEADLGNKSDGESLVLLNQLLPVSRTAAIAGQSMGGR